MLTYKLTIALTRSFSIGITVASPKLNGCCVEVRAACFLIRFWNRGRRWFAVRNYWHG